MNIKQTSFCTFELEFKNGSVLVNPTKKAETDIVIYSQAASSYLKYDDVKSSLIVKNAGEFEIKDIFVEGRKNTREESFVYIVSADDVTIGIVSLTNELNNIPVDIFESADVLLICAGSGPFLSPENAKKLADKVAPSVAIYAGFKEQASKDLENTLDSMEEAKKEIPALSTAGKSIKIDKDYVDGLDSTVHFYFEL